MDSVPPDLDAARRSVAADELVTIASGYLTDEVARHLEFHEVVMFKNLLKRFFSAAPWGSDDEARLDALVGDHLQGDPWWEHDLGGGIVMAHGVRDGAYRLWVSSGSS